MEHVSTIRFDDSPGHLLRRAQQIHTETWGRDVVDDITGPQYATLVAISGWDDVDQKRAGELASLDTSTVGGVVRRLENKGWITRTVSPVDARRRLLALTDHARQRLPLITEAAGHVQQSLLAALDDDEAVVLVSLLRKVAFPEGVPIESAPNRTDSVLELGTTPGYLIRRAQQVHFAMWNDRFDGELTSPQYAVLVAAARTGSLDQARIGAHASLDSSSVADIVSRLETRGWLRRRRDPADGRRVLVDLTVPAATAITHLTTSVAQVQQLLLAPLAPDEPSTFMAYMRRIAPLEDHSTAD